MIRQIIKIDNEKCNGCGACVKACHEGAIAIIDGKAKLTRDDYCDGLGNCLPICQTNAITFENREADAFDEVAMKKRMGNDATSSSTTSARSSAQNNESSITHSKCPTSQNNVISKDEKLTCGCPSTSAITFDKKTK